MIYNSLSRKSLPSQEFSELKIGELFHKAQGRPLILSKEKTTRLRTRQEELGESWLAGLSYRLFCQPRWNGVERGKSQSGSQDGLGVCWELGGILIIIGLRDFPRLSSHSPINWGEMALPTSYSRLLTPYIQVAHTAHQGCCHHWSMPEISLGGFLFQKPF